MLYLAVFPGRKENYLNEEFFLGNHNRIAELSPDDARWEKVIRVVDVSAATGGRRLYLSANALNQRAVCYLGSR